MALTDGILALWNLDESGSNTRLDSVGVIDCDSVIGSPDSAEGVIDDAILLDGASTMFNAGADSPWGNHDSISCSVWVYPTDNGTLEQKIIFVRDTGGNTAFQIATLNTSGRVRVSVRDAGGATTSVDSTSGLANNTWHHILIVYVRNDNLYLYINNGAPFTGSVNDQPVSNTASSHHMIGRAVSASAWWVGRIDQLAVWGRALTSDERASLYNSGDGVAIGSPGLLTDLLHLWELEEASGTRVDSKGDLDLDTEVGTPSSAAGVVGRALSLDGTTEKVYETGTAHDFAGSDELTISVWINLNNPGVGQDSIFYARANSLNTLFLRALNTSGVINCNIRDDASTVYSLNGPVLSSSTWYHVVLIYRQNSLVHLVVDGVVVNTVDADDQPFYSSVVTPEVFIGGENAGATGLDGLVDQVGIWNRALWLIEVSQLNNGGAGLRLIGALNSTMAAGWLRR